MLDRQSAELIGEAVVDVAVVGLVGADDQHHVAQRRVVGQLPVVPGDLRRGHVRRCGPRRSP